MGTSIGTTLKSGAVTDHPHACGDKLILRSSRTASRGSSPRVWGQVVGKMRIQGDIRIIPTRVGTSG